MTVISLKIDPARNDEMAYKNRLPKIEDVVGGYRINRFKVSELLKMPNFKKKCWGNMVISCKYLCPLETVVC
jgi:hypothetical protein